MSARNSIAYILAVTLAGALLIGLGAWGLAAIANTRCELIAIAYDETDDMAPAWYDEAAAALAECGLPREHTEGDRGRLW